MSWCKENVWDEPRHSVGKLYHQDISSFLFIIIMTVKFLVNCWAIMVLPIERSMVGYFYRWDNSTTKWLGHLMDITHVYLSMSDGSLLRSDSSVDYVSMAMTSCVVVTMMHCE